MTALRGSLTVGKPPVLPRGISELGTGKRLGSLEGAAFLVDVFLKMGGGLLVELLVELLGIGEAVTVMVLLS
jgi:hypothetical protein